MRIWRDLLEIADVAGNGFLFGILTWGMYNVFQYHADYGLSLGVWAVTIICWLVSLTNVIKTYPR